MPARPAALPALLLALLPLAPAVAAPANSAAATPSGQYLADQRLIEITGLEAPLAQAALAAAEPSFGCASPRWVVNNQARRIADQVRRQLRGRGHYQVDIQRDVTALATAPIDDTASNGPCWQVLLTVSPGPITLVRNLAVEILGPPVPALQAVQQAQTPKPGDPFREAAYEQLKQALGNAALAAGYLDARFSTARVDVFPEQQAADIALTLDPGGQHRFGTVTVHPPDLALRPELVARLHGVTSGEPFSAALLGDAQQALWQSGFFRNVDVQAKFDAIADHQVPVAIHLVLQPRHELTAGAGFATDFGPRLRTEYANRRVNSRGHQSNILLQVSPVVSELQADWRMPLGGARKRWLNLDAGLKHEDTDSARSDAITLGARLVTELDNSWQRALFLDASIERFNISDLDRRARLFMPGVRYSHVSSQGDGPRETGHRFEVEVRGAAELLGSTTSFAQAWARLNHAMTLGERWRLLTRLELGSTAQASFSSLPPSVRFFAGGDNSVRGYDFEALGPRDELGEVIGGRHLLVASAELEFSVLPSWSVATFYDVGNAFDDPRDLDLARGIGAGIRWHSPVGAIRLDLAHPLDNDRSVRLHLGVGRLF